MPLLPTPLPETRTFQRTTTNHRCATLGHTLVTTRTPVAEIAKAGATTGEPPGRTQRYYAETHHVCDAVVLVILSNGCFRNQVDAVDVLETRSIDDLNQSLDVRQNSDSGCKEDCNECGPDGCGGSCGQCPFGEVCTTGTCETVPQLWCGAETLVGHWTMDDNDGETVLDSSGNALTGTVSGAQWIEGVSGTGLHFDGLNDWVEIGNLPQVNFSTAFSLSAWIRSDSWLGDGRIVCKRNDVSGAGYAMAVKDDKLFTYLYMQDAFGSSTSIPVDQWVHVGVTFDSMAGDVSLFINGKLDSKFQPSTSVASSNVPLFFGRKGEFANELYNGDIDEVHVFSCPLDELQMKQLFQAQCTPECGSKVCGEDACVGSCGSCASDAVCNQGQCYSCPYQDYGDIGAPENIAPKTSDAGLYNDSTDYWTVTLEAEEPSTVSVGMDKVALSLTSSNKPGAWTLISAGSEAADIFPGGGHFRFGGKYVARNGAKVSWGLSDGFATVLLATRTNEGVDWHDFDDWIIESVGDYARMSIDGGLSFGDWADVSILGPFWYFYAEGSTEMQGDDSFFMLASFEVGACPPPGE